MTETKIKANGSTKSKCLKGEKMDSDSSRSDNKNTGPPPFVYLFFIFVGLLFLFFFLIRPVLKIMDARSWVETPCRVIAAEVYTSSDGDTYKPHITFEYEFDEKKYESDQYNCIGSYTSGRFGKERIVAYYLKHRDTVCYVNPDNPREAVMNRSIGFELLYGLIPLIFVIVGILGLIGASKNIKEGNKDEPDE